MVWYVSSLSSHVPSVNAMLFHNQCSVSKDHSKILLQLSLSQIWIDISKSPKQMPNCLKIAETSVVLIVFNDVNFSFCRSTWIGYQKCLIRSMTNTDPLYKCSKSHNCRINYDIHNMKLHMFLHFNLNFLCLYHAALGTAIFILCCYKIFVIELLCITLILE